MWYFVENDCIMEDAQRTYEFFICQGTEIIEESFSLYDDTCGLLKEYSNDFTMNMAEDQAAISRMSSQSRNVLFLPR
jgi:hypothetical protein